MFYKDERPEECKLPTDRTKLTKRKRRSPAIPDNAREYFIKDSVGNNILVCAVPTPIEVPPLEKTEEVKAEILEIVPDFPELLPDPPCCEPDSPVETIVDHFQKFREIKEKYAVVDVDKGPGRDAPAGTVDIACAGNNGAGDLLQPETTVDMYKQYLVYETVVRMKFQHDCNDINVDYDVAPNWIIELWRRSNCWDAVLMFRETQGRWPFGNGDDVNDLVDFRTFIKEYDNDTWKKCFLEAVEEKEDSDDDDDDEDDSDPKKPKQPKPRPKPPPGGPGGGGGGGLPTGGVLPVPVPSVDVEGIWCAAKAIVTFGADTCGSDDEDEEWTPPKKPDPDAKPVDPTTDPKDVPPGVPKPEDPLDPDDPGLDTPGPPIPRPVKDSPPVKEDPLNPDDPDPDDPNPPEDPWTTSNDIPDEFNVIPPYDPTPPTTSKPPTKPDVFKVMHWWLDYCVQTYLKKTLTNGIKNGWYNAYYIREEDGTYSLKYNPVDPIANKPLRPVSVIRKVYISDETKVKVFYNWKTFYKYVNKEPVPTKPRDPKDKPEGIVYFTTQQWIKYLKNNPWRTFIIKEVIKRLTPKEVERTKTEISEVMVNNYTRDELGKIIPVPAMTAVNVTEEINKHFDLDDVYYVIDNMIDIFKTKLVDRIYTNPRYVQHNLLFDDFMYKYIEGARYVFRAVMRTNIPTKAMYPAEYNAYVNDGFIPGAYTRETDDLYPLEDKSKPIVVFEPQQSRDYFLNKDFTAVHVEVGYFNYTDDYLDTQHWRDRAVTSPTDFVKWTGHPGRYISIQTARAGYNQWRLAKE